MSGGAAVDLLLLSLLPAAAVMKNAPHEREENEAVPSKRVKERRSDKRSPRPLRPPLVTTFHLSSVVAVAANIVTLSSLPCPVLYLSFCCCSLHPLLLSAFVQMSI